MAGCTMDNQIIFDVLSNALHASRILKMSASYQDSLRSMLNRLAPMQIGKYNQLQEWLEDLDNPNDKHRHISHVYGLFPSNQISPYTHPLLFQAAKTRCYSVATKLPVGPLAGKLICGPVCWTVIMRSGLLIIC